MYQINGIDFSTQTLSKIAVAVGTVAAICTGAKIYGDYQNPQTSKIDATGLATLGIKIAQTALPLGLVAGAVMHRGKLPPILQNSLTVLPGYLLGLKQLSYSESSYLNATIASLAGTIGIISGALSLEFLARLKGRNEAADRISNGIKTMALVFGLSIGMGFETGNAASIGGLIGTIAGVGGFSKASELTAFALKKLVDAYGTN